MRYHVAAGGALMMLRISSNLGRHLNHQCRGHPFCGYAGRLIGDLPFGIGMPDRWTEAKHHEPTARTLAILDLAPPMRIIARMEHDDIELLDLAPSDTRHWLTIDLDNAGIVDPAEFNILPCFRSFVVRLWLCDRWRLVHRQITIS